MCIHSQLAMLSIHVISSALYSQLALRGQTIFHAGSYRYRFQYNRVPSHILYYSQTARFTWPLGQSSPCSIQHSFLPGLAKAQHIAGLVANNASWIGYDAHCVSGTEYSNNYLPQLAIEVQMDFDGMMQVQESFSFGDAGHVGNSSTQYLQLMNTWNNTLTF